MEVSCRYTARNEEFCSRCVAPGGRKNQDFLIVFSKMGRILSTLRPDRICSAAKDKLGFMWVGRALTFFEARNRLKGLVAGVGFEPTTFGL